MYRNDKLIRRYSEAFKLKILAELTIGKHTKSELCKLYLLRTNYTRTHDKQC